MNNPDSLASIVEDKWHPINFFISNAIYKKELHCDSTSQLPPPKGSHRDHLTLVFGKAGKIIKSNK